MKRSGISKWLLLVLLLVSISIAACLIKKDSAAPGCVQYWGPAGLGGCFGKTAILDLQSEPEIDCLEIGVNNCNGGVLEVSNACDESLVLGGVKIQPSQRNLGLDVKKESGEYLLIYSDGNFSRHVPQEDETIEISGTLGDQEIIVTFTKTKELC